MPFIFGLLGFELYTEMTVAEIRLFPVFSGSKAALPAFDSEHLILTAYGILPENANPSASGQRAWSHIACLIADAMTFCQQQEVRATAFVEIGKEPEIAQAVRKLAQAVLHCSRGRPEMLVEGERGSPGSRERLLNLFVSRMRAPTGSRIDLAIYRQLEIARLSNRFWELEFHLAFTGLELVARDFGGRRDAGPIARPLSEMLRSLGFDVPVLTAEKMVTAREALFLAGEDSKLHENTGEIVYALAWVRPLRVLLADVCLKKLGFEDERINWSRWAQRERFLPPPSRQSSR